MNINRYRLFSLLLSAIFMLVLSIAINAAGNKEQERPLPKVYPYSTPYDEPHCPSGKCDRSNENPKQNHPRDENGQRPDED